MPQQRALISVYDKRMLVDFAPWPGVARHRDCRHAPAHARLCANRACPLAVLMSLPACPRSSAGASKPSINRFLPVSSPGARVPNKWLPWKNATGPAIDLVVVNLAPMRETMTPRRIGRADRCRGIQFDPGRRKKLCRCHYNHQSQRLRAHLATTQGGAVSGWRAVACWQ